MTCAKNLVMGIALGVVLSAGIGLIVGLGFVGWKTAQMWTDSHLVAVGAAGFAVCVGWGAFMGILECLSPSKKAAEEAPPSQDAAA